MNRAEINDNDPNVHTEERGEREPLVRDEQPKRTNLTLAGCTSVFMSGWFAASTAAGSAMYGDEPNPVAVGVAGAVGLISYPLYCALLLNLETCMSGGLSTKIALSMWSLLHASAGLVGNELATHAGVGTNVDWEQALAQGASGAAVFDVPVAAAMSYATTYY